MNNSKIPESTPLEVAKQALAQAEASIMTAPCGTCEVYATVAHCPECFGNGWSPVTEVGFRRLEAIRALRRMLHRDGSVRVKLNQLVPGVQVQSDDYVSPLYVAVADLPVVTVLDSYDRLRLSIPLVDGGYVEGLQGDFILALLDARLLETLLPPPEEPAEGEELINAAYEAETLRSAYDYQ